MSTPPRPPSRRAGLGRGRAIAAVVDAAAPPELEPGRHLLLRLPASEYLRVDRPRPRAARQIAPARLDFGDRLLQRAASHLLDPRTLADRDAPATRQSRSWCAAAG